ncbi:MAG: hypothetical protein ACRCTQ_01895 [Brevinemataceae bacterium]
MLHARVSDFMMLPVPKRLDTKEDLIKIDSRTLDRREQQDALARNIYFLELALAMPFDHPVKALVRITNEQQYQKYKFAVCAHLFQRLADEYVQYGNLFFKENIYFYNNEFYQEYLDGYDISEFYYNAALIYRRKALEQAKLAAKISGELNPNKDQILIDFDQKIYLLIDDPFDFEAVYAGLLKKIENNRNKIRSLQQ